MTRRPFRRTALTTLVVAASVVLVLAVGAAAAGASVRQTWLVPAGGSASVGVPGPWIVAWSPAVLPADRPQPATAQRPVPGRRGSYTLFSDDFDVFPDRWELFNNPRWGQSSYKASTGEFSAYCIGSQFPTPPASGYPSNLNSWM